MLLDTMKILLGKQRPLKIFPSLILWNKLLYAFSMAKANYLIILDKYAVLKYISYEDILTD